jgi:aminocarboxymuconate-semialdehyde decarboxylase
MTRSRVIDLHNHTVPKTILTGDAQRSALWPSVQLTGSGTANVMVGDRLFREITSQCWDVAERIADMDAEGVDIQVLSPMPELLSHWMPFADADYLGAQVNGAIGEMIAAAPDRFAGFGMCSVQNPSQGATSLERLKADGFRGVEIGTHIDGVALGDRSLDPFYGLCEQLGFAVMVHGLRPAALERLGPHPVLTPVSLFPTDTALAITAIIVGGVLDRFPRLKIMCSHGGGAFPFMLARLQHAWSIGGPVTDMLPRAPVEYARELWYDCLVYDPANLAFLGSLVGTERIVVGSDYPFAIRQVRPGDIALQTFDGAIGQDVCWANGFRLIGADIPQ